MHFFEEARPGIREVNRWRTACSVCIGVLLLFGWVGSSRGAQLLIYLSGDSPHPPDIYFEIRQLSVASETGEEIQIPFRTGEIGSLYTAANQIKLAEGEISPGRYISIRWVLDHARIVKAGRSSSLALPEQKGAISFPVEFEIRKGESLSLFLLWSVKESVLDGYLFHPKVEVRRQRMELSRLLLFVTNAGSNNVSVVDRDANRIVGNIPVGRAPKGMAVDERSGRIYVANSGSNDVSVIDAVKYRVVNRIPLRNAMVPTEMVLGAFRRYLYITNSGSNDVSVVDVRAGTEIQHIKVGNGPVGIARDEVGQRLYVADSLSNTISIIDTKLLRLTGAFRVGAGPVDLLVDGETLLVINHDAGNLSVIDRNTSSTLREIPTGQRPFRLSMGRRKRVYVTNQSSRDISLIYPMVNLEIKRIRVGGRPAGITVDETQNKLFVTDEEQDRLIVINLSNEKVVARVPTGKGPYGLALFR